MAIKNLADYFTIPTLPMSGGFSVANTTPAVAKSTYVSPGSAFVPVPYVPPPFTPPVHPAAPAPVAPSTTPLFSPKYFGPAGGTGPTGPSGGTGATGSTIPPQWLNADGSIKTPDQIAADVGGALKSAHGNGDIGTLSLDQFGGDGKSAEQLAADARRIGNARNDIAVGETDPYKVASQSGIAYTPEELNAIEKAYAGVYDPALDTAMAKVQAKQDSDAAATKDAGFTLGKDEVRYDADGNPIAVGPSSTGASGDTYVAGQNPVVDAYVKGFGTIYKAGDIPDEYKDLVAQGVASNTGSGAPISPTSTTAIGIINELQGLPDLDKLSGTGLIGGIEHPSSLFPGTAVQTTQNLAKQLQATISLANRQQLKGSGAISDFEFRVLGDAATALGLDENGRTNLSPTDFKDQLNKLKIRLAVGPTSLTDDEVQWLSSPEGGSYTPDQIRAYSSGRSFSPVGNTTASKVSLGTGNRPQRNFNPGDIKSGGLSDSLAIGTDTDGSLIFPDAATGFKALTADLTAKVNGSSKYLPANPTIAQLGKVYAEDPNWPKKVAAILGVPVDTHTQTIPIANLAKAVASQEGFYA